MENYRNREELADSVNKQILKKFYRDNPNYLVKETEKSWGAENWTEEMWNEKFAEIVSFYKKKADKNAKKGKTGLETDYIEMMFDAIIKKYGVDPRDGPYQMKTASRIARDPQMPPGMPARMPPLPQEAYPRIFYMDEKVVRSPNTLGKETARQGNERGGERRLTDPRLGRTEPQWENQPSGKAFGFQTNVR